MRLTFWLRCPVDSGSGRQSRGHLRRAGSNCIRPVKRLCLRRSGGKLVFTSGCDGCAGIGASALEALVTVAVSVFLATERLDGSRVEALDGAARLSTSSSRRTDSIFWSVTNSASVASGIVLSSSILSSNRTSIVACMVPLRWIPVGDLVLTGASFYWTLEDFATRPKCRGAWLTGRRPDRGTEAVLLPVR